MGKGVRAVVFYDVAADGPIGHALQFVAAMPGRKQLGSGQAYHFAIG